MTQRDDINRHPSSIQQVTLAEAKAIISADIPRRAIRELIWHHFWCPAAAQYKGKRTMRGVKRHQMKPVKEGGLGAWDVGYTWLTSPTGDIFTGRPLRGMSGAHTLGHNHHSVGLAMCLNGDEEDLNDFPEMREAMLALSLHICGVYRLSEEELHWHRDFASKSCPGKLLGRDYYRQLLRDRFAGIGGSKWVRLKLNDEPVRDARLVNEGGAVVVKCQFTWYDEDHKPRLFREGRPVREVLEAIGFTTIAWHGEQGPAGVVYGYR